MAAAERSGPPPPQWRPGSETDRGRPASAFQAGSFISDSTIRFEMSIFGAVMNYAVKKRDVPAI
jgi:hypothetical protein